MRVVTLDVETVALNYTGDPEKFPNLPLHTPVAICWMVTEGQSLRIEKRYGHPGNSWECLALQDFKEDCREANRLVTFNGRSFDLPVLTLRAICHHVPWKQLNELLRNRFPMGSSPPFHVDLLELLGNYGATRSMKLSELASSLGFPGKYGMEGSKVTQAYQEGKLQDIADYCVNDILLTRLIYLKAWGVLGGSFTSQEIRTWIRQTIQQTLELYPNLHELYKGWIDV
jgi:predicted PolB exonuclease-like 3'-5' exonuclease